MSSGSVLRGFRVLDDLTDAEVEALLGYTTEVCLDRGEYLFDEGAPGDAMYFVHDGVVVVERLIDEEAGTRKDLAILPSMSVVGDMALADDSPRSAAVRIELPVRARRLSRESFDKLYAESSATALKLMRALFAEASRRLRNTNEELVAVYEVGRFVASATEPNAVAEAIMRNLSRRLNASYGLIGIYDRETNGLRIRYATGDRANALLGGLVPLSTGIVARVFDEKRAVLVERLLGATEPWESTSMIFAPLVVRDAAVGVLLFGEAVGQAPYKINQMTLVTAVANISSPILLEALPK